MSEHLAFGYIDPRALNATRVIEDDRSPLIRYIAERMRRVATPYWPCTDLMDPKETP